MRVRARVKVRAGTCLGLRWAKVGVEVKHHMSCPVVLMSTTACATYMCAHDAGSHERICNWSIVHVCMGAQYADMEILSPLRSGLELVAGLGLGLG